MVIALGSFASTFGLVLIFFVMLPVLAQGLIGFAAAQALGERAQNEEYRSGGASADADHV